jgi:hypothetical protein
VDFDEDGDPIVPPVGQQPEQKKLEEDPVVKKALELLASKV